MYLIHRDYFFVNDGGDDDNNDEPNKNDNSFDSSPIDE